MFKKLITPWYRPVAFILGLAPLFYYLAQALWGDGLGANPIATAISLSGEWSIYLLLLGLCATPLQRLFKVRFLLTLRRMIGLYAFFYLIIHMALYIALDQYFDWAYIWQDFLQRQYMTVGWIAFLMMLMLALSSTQGWQRRLKRRWNTLHMMVYPTMVLSVLHVYILTRADFRDPYLYAAITALLLSLRLGWKLKAKMAEKQAAKAKVAMRAKSQANINGDKHAAI